MRDLDARARICSRTVQEKADSSDCRSNKVALFSWISDVNIQYSPFCQPSATLRAGINSRHVRAIPWPSGRWRARRRIDSGHAGRLHSRERAWGPVQPRCRGGGGVGRGKGCRRRHRSGGGPPATRDAHGRGRHSAAQRTCARRAGRRHGARAGGWDRLPRDGAPLVAPLDGVRNRRRAAATEAGAQARTPTGQRGRVEPRESLRAVAAPYCHLPPFTTPYCPSMSLTAPYCPSLSFAAPYCPYAQPDQAVGFLA